MERHGCAVVHLPRILRKGVALEHDGSLYSCDHYVYPEYKLGNILETSSSRLVFSEQQKQFGFNKFNSLPRQCAECATQDGVPEAVISAATTAATISEQLAGHLPQDLRPA